MDLSASVTAAAIFTLGAQLLGGYLANHVRNTTDYVNKCIYDSNLVL